MPNNITNKLSMKAQNPDDVNEVLEFIKDADSDFDFNKVVPMPKDIANCSSEYTGSMPHWYTWSCDNWGTKWNAYDASVDGNVVHFQTAWSNVTILIQKLADKFPQVCFLYEYTDSDTGSQCGQVLFFENNTKENIFPNSSREAYEHCFKLDPVSAQYYELIDGNYEHVER